MLLSLKRLILFDTRVAFILASRVWLMVGGGITVLLVPSYLSAEQQGYYYAFNSLIAIQVFVDLGLNSILMQYSARVVGQHLKDTDALLEAPAARQHLSDLLSIGRRWATASSILLFAIVSFSGWIFFKDHGTLDGSQWIIPWLVLSGATSLSVYAGPLLAIAEGSGHITNIARLRLALSMIGYLVFWLLLVNHFGLAACVSLAVVNAAGCLIWVCWYSRTTTLPEHSLEAPRSEQETPLRLSWRGDILPLQWRTGLSWIGGYFFFYFMTPIVFTSQGPSAAGKLGLALTMFSAASTVSMSWIYAALPEMSGKFVRKEFPKLRAKYDTLIKVSAATLLTLICIILLFVVSIGFFFPKIPERIPSFATMCLLAVATMGNFIIFCRASYIRLHAEEPLVLQSLVSAALLTGGIVVASHYGLEAVSAVYAVLTICVPLPWITLIYRSYRERY